MRAVLLATLAAISISPVFAQSLEPLPPPPGVTVPDWALPQSANHKQVPPPADFHRASVTVNAPIGQFDGQSDVGGALAPGSASFDTAAKTYTINSAGYNIWYQRDEFRYLWKKMSGDVSLAATVNWPSLDDFHDRKVVLIFRDSLDDDSRQIMAAQHGNGMVHISWRPEKGSQMTDVEYRSARQPRAGTDEKGPQTFQLYISWQGEPLHAEGMPVTFKTSGPVYVGIGFTSHLAANVLTAKVADVVVENRAGAVR
jgi:hypothetical protein